MSRLQILLVAVALIVAVTLAVPAMHGSNLERWLRGECTLAPGGRFANFHCPPQKSDPER